MVVDMILNFELKIFDYSDRWSLKDKGGGVKKRDMVDYEASFKVY